jgi:hypothetical protein
METETHTRLYAGFSPEFAHTGSVFTPPVKKDDILRKDKGERGRGDGWYNTAPTIANLVRYGKDLTAFFTTLFIATFKLDGFQTGVTIKKNHANEPEVETFWSRNRELDAEEQAGTKKIGNAGSMGNAYNVFKDFALRISTIIFNNDANIAKVTVTGEGYRASHGKQFAKFASIHPFQLILELVDKTEVVLLMTPELHNFLRHNGTCHNSFRDAVDMNMFLLQETQCHVFPVPILHIGNLHDCIRAGHRLAMTVHELYVEGIMITPIVNPNFVMKLKTPQQMKGEFSSIKRLAKLDVPESEIGDSLMIQDPEIRASYQLLVDIYDAFLSLSVNEKKDVKMSAEASDVQKELEVMLKSMIQPAFHKFIASDTPKHNKFDGSVAGFLTEPIPKAEFFPFVAKIKDFVVAEIAKNYAESSGQELDKNVLKNLGKKVQDYLLTQFPTPVS